MNKGGKAWEKQTVGLKKKLYAFWSPVPFSIIGKNENNSVLTVFYHYCFRMYKTEQNKTKQFTINVYAEYHRSQMFSAKINEKDCAI